MFALSRNVNFRHKGPELNSSWWSSFFLGDEAQQLSGRLAQANPFPDCAPLSIVQLIGVFVQQTMINDLPARGIIYECADDEPVFIRAQGRLRPTPPTVIPQRNGYWEFSRIEMDVGFLIKQRRLNYDQAASYRFVIALDDCINGTTHIAKRDHDEATTDIEISDRPRLPDDHYLRNGIVLHTFERELFNYNEASASVGSASISHPQLCQAFLARKFPGVPPLPYVEEEVS